MRKLKLIIATIACGFLFIGNSIAQSPFHHRGDSSQKSPEEMADMMTVKMKYALNLTADQESKVKAINQKYAKQKKDYMDANKKQMDEFEKGWKTIDTEKDKELSTVLKPDQITKYNAKKDEMRKHHGHHGGHHKGHKK